MPKHDKKKEVSSFEGRIKMISCSPHGDPEGIVLENGAFIKTPPHSLLAKEKFEIGTTIHGEGELIASEPNEVFHHAQVMSGKTMLSDDSIDKDSKEELKEKHKAEIKKRKDQPGKVLKTSGTIAALASKPKGELDRILLTDGTSIHIPKDLELSAEDFELGAVVEAKGEFRDYGSMKFLKAESVKLTP